MKRTRGSTLEGSMFELLFGLGQATPIAPFAVCPPAEAAEPEVVATAWRWARCIDRTHDARARWLAVAEQADALSKAPINMGLPDLERAHRAMEQLLLPKVARVARFYAARAPSGGSS